MGNERGRILVIDDDEVVLVAITDLLETAQYKVFSQTSPIGATSVIAREDIDLAVIDVNLPVLQGDNVVRLLRGWDRLKDLPLIVVSGEAPDKLKQIQTDVKNVRAISKANMHRGLVSLVEEMMKARPSNAVTVRTKAPRDTDFRTRFVDQVSSQLAGSSVAFAQVKSGNAEQREALLRTLSVLRGQAHLLGLTQASRLLETLHAVIDAVSPGRSTPPEVDGAVDDAFRALIGLKRTSGDFLLSPEPLIESLARAASALQPRQAFGT